MVDAELLIPMNKNARSVNMAISAAMAVTEGLRQTNGFPKL
jgi:tRNA (cytidine/uridine-2'-O-)-methyltransferase